MEDNSLYTTHKNVMARISSKIKSKKIEESNIIEWCQHVETDILGDVDNMYTYIAYKLDVIKYLNTYIAYLPCNIYRLLDVYTDYNNDSSRVKYNRMKGYVDLGPNYPYDYVYIDFKGTPVDLKTGIPYIIVGHEMACEAYCIYQMYYEDILNDRLSIDSKNRLATAMDNAILAAMSTSARHKTREHLNRDQVIMGNLVPKLANFRLLYNEF